MRIYFEQFEEQSSFLALAEISQSGVGERAVQDDVDAVDRVKVIGVSRLHLHHVPRHYTGHINIRPSATYRDIVIIRFFKTAAVRHLGFVISGPHTKSTWWSLSLCKI